MKNQNGKAEKRGKRKQCPYCIDNPVFMAKHMVNHHPEKIEEWIQRES